MYNEFCQTIEEDAIGLDDYFFVRLTDEILDAISQLQHESDPLTYKSKWERNVGEVLFLYNANSGSLGFPREIRLEEIPYCEKEEVDLRLAEKISLTRAAARKYAQYLYNGHALMDDIGDDAAIAMMLFIRNGLGKSDFWKCFRRELANGLEELIGGKDSLDIERILVKDAYEEPSTIVDLVKLAESNSQTYPYKAFHLLTDELIQVLKDTDNLDEDDHIKEFKNQYVMIFSERHDFDDPAAFMTLEELRKTKDKVILQDMNFLPYLAACVFEDEFDWNACETEDMVWDFGSGIALYEINGKTAKDFWHDFCKELVAQMKEKPEKESGV